MRDTVLSDVSTEKTSTSPTPLILDHDELADIPSPVVTLNKLIHPCPPPPHNTPNTVKSIQFTMRFGSLLLLAVTTSAVQAFAPVALTRGVSATQLFSDKPDSEEGLDLNLDEMFEMSVRPMISSTISG